MINFTHTHHHQHQPRSPQQTFAIPRWFPWSVGAITVGYLLVTIVVAKLLLSGITSQTVTTLARWTPIPVARVGGYLIWARRYEDFKSFIDTFLQRSADAGNVIDPSTPVEQQVVQILVDNRVLELAADHAGIQVMSEEVDAAYHDILVSQSGQSPKEVSNEELQTILEELYGSNQDELRQLIKVRLLEDKVKSDLLEQVNFRQILVSDERQAKDLIQQLQNGASFDDLAKQYSQHQESRDNGGEIGFVARGEQLPAEVESVVFSADPGLITTPVKSEFGYHVIEVLEKRGTVQQSFTDWLATAHHTYPSNIYIKNVS